MKRGALLDIILSLACSQGFYGRLLRDLRENPEWAEEFWKAAEAQNFRTDLDFIVWLEC